MQFGSRLRRQAFDGPAGYLQHGVTRDPSRSPARPYGVDEIAGSVCALPLHYRMQCRYHALPIK